MVLLLISFLCVAYSLDIQDINVLSILKNAWSDSSHLPDSWVSPEDGCSWLGIQCDSSGEHVVGLHLNGLGLKGILPCVISELSYLEVIEFGLLNKNIKKRNWLGGKIPLELGSLTRLRYLDLSFNEFNGIIPPELGNASELEYLNLGVNPLIGSIPPELGRLGRLQQLRIGSSPGLRSSGLPKELGHLTSLTFLDLSNNFFGGSIPSEFGKLFNLSVLYLDHNDLVGELPSSLRNLVRLEGAMLGFNKLQGGLPDWISEWRQLEVLSLHSNQFRGSLPSSWGNLDHLTIIDLTEIGINVSGTIPGAWGRRWTNLQQFRMSSTGVSGEFPSGFSAMHALQSLDISGNNYFEGANTKDILGGLPKLSILTLRSNGLSGNFSLSNNSFPALKNLDLSGNVELIFSEDSLDSNLCFSNIEMLNVSGIRYVSLEAVCQFCHLAILIASGSGIQTVPYCFNELTLPVVVLQNNLIAEQSFLATPNSINYLDLRGNAISSINSNGFLKLLIGFYFVESENCNVVRQVSPTINVLLLGGNTLKEFPNYVNVHCNSSYTRGAYVDGLSIPLRELDLSNNTFGPHSDISFPFPSTLKFLELKGNPDLDLQSLVGSSDDVEHDAPFLLKNSSFAPNVPLPLLCSMLSLRGAPYSSTVYYDADMSSYFLCRCLSGYFGAPLQCRKCDEVMASGFSSGAICFYNGSLGLQDGFFPQAASLPNSKRTRNEELIQNSVFLTTPVRCPVKEACLFHDRCLYLSGTGNLTCQKPICAEGYKGRLCSQCARGFFIAGERECEVCPKDDSFYRSDGFLAILLCISLFAIILFIFLRGFGVAALLVELVLLSVFVYIRIAEGWLLSIMLLLAVVYISSHGGNESSGGLLKSLLFFIQSFYALSPKYLFKAVFKGFYFNPFRGFILANLRPFGIECFNSLEILARPDYRMAFDLLLPVTVLIITVVVVFCSELLLLFSWMNDSVRWYEEKQRKLFDFLSPRKILRNSLDISTTFDGMEMSQVLFEVEEDMHLEDSTSHEAHPSTASLWVRILSSMVHSSLFVLYALFFEIAHVILVVFHHDEYGYMGAPYEYLLSPYTGYGWKNEPQGRNLLILGIIGLVFFVIFIPLLYLFLMVFFWWKSFRHGDFHGPAVWIGFLYEGFRREVYWYEMVWMTRRLLLAVILSVIPQDNVWSPILISLLLLISLVLHSYAKPFQSHWENTIERLSLMALFFTFTLGQMLEPGALLGNPPGPGQNWHSNRWGYIFIFVVDAFVLIGYLLVFCSNYLAAIGNFVIRSAFKMDLKDVARKITVNREQQLELVNLRQRKNIEDLRKENEFLRRRTGFLLNE